LFEKSYFNVIDDYVIASEMMQFIFYKEILEVK